MQDGPGEAAVTAVIQESENPERVWNAEMATTTALEIATLANAARASQVCLVNHELRFGKTVIPSENCAHSILLR